MCNFYVSEEQLYLNCKKSGFGREKLQLYKLLIFGPPGVGKSSLFKVLLGENPNKVRNSTGVLKVVQVQVKIAINKLYCDDSTEWKLFSLEDEISRLQKVIKQKTEHQDLPFAYTTYDKSKLTDLDKLLMEDVDTTGDCAETILICYDSGGHLEFFDVMPALTTVPTGNIMVFNMEKGLGRYSVDGFHIDGECHASQGHTEINCTRLLQSAFANIQSVLKRRTTSESSQSLLVVGTHFDKCGTAAEQLETLKKLDETIYEQILAKDTSLVKTREFCKDSKIIHPISNTIESKERNTIAQEIRTAIEQMSKEEIDYSEIQIEWHLFQLEIQQTNKSCIGQSEYTKIAENCNMTQNDAEKALHFYHELGILLHYREIVDVVFCNPQWLFDRLTDLIVQKYKPYTFDIRENIKKGKFTTKGLLDIYNDKLDRTGPLTLTDLTNIFIHQNIMAHMPNKNEYFMPALLQPVPQSFDPSEFCGKKIGDTLLVEFENTYVPRGVFCCLVVNLAKHNWVVLENVTYKDLISFQISSNQYFVLVDKIKCIGVEVYLKEDQKITSLQNIFSLLYQSLKDTCAKMKIGWNFSFGFPSICSNCTEIACVDFLFPSPLELKCKTCGKKDNIKNHDQLIWLLPPHVTEMIQKQVL